MEHEKVHRLLDRIAVLRHSSDLDLLLFFVRHPRALLSSDQIAALLGYPVNRLGDSLDVLVTADLLLRTQRPNGVARLYVFADRVAADWLPALVGLASTRAGRLALRNALEDRRKGEPSIPGSVADTDLTPQASLKDTTRRN